MISKNTDDILWNGWDTNLHSINQKVISLSQLLMCIIQLLITTITRYSNKYIDEIKELIGGLRSQFRVKLYSYNM